MTQVYSPQQGRQKKETTTFAFLSLLLVGNAVVFSQSYNKVDAYMGRASTRDQCRLA